MTSIKSFILSASLPVMIHSNAYATLINMCHEDHGFMTKKSSSTLLKVSTKEDVELWLDVESIKCRTQELGQALTNQPNTTHLALSTLSLEDNVLEIVSQFPTLQHLFLEENIFTDQGAKFLERFTTLKELDLSRHYITSKGLHYIPLDKLKSFYINFLDLTDISFIDTLKRVPQLEILHICGMSTNNQMLEQLAQSTSLRQLNVSYSQVTSDGVEKVKQQNPHLSMTFDT